MSGLDDRIGKGTETAGGGGLGDLLGGLAGGSTGAGGGLGDILGGLTGGSGGGPAGAAPGGIGGVLTALVPRVGGMLEGGGLQRVLAGLEANGLGEQAASWIGRGANQAISGADLEQVVGHDAVAGIAGRLGITEADAASALAQVLPAVVDTVSPEGTLPPADELETALGSLGGESPPPPTA
jgi:uncharacterized protein YidB (DUF937 family)